MSEITQVISPFTGVAPNSQTQLREDFDASANELASKFAIWPDEYNALRSQANALSSSVNSAASTVEAIGTGFLGRWSDLGAIAVTIGQSVEHEGRLWISLVPIADATTSEPSMANSDWMITNDNSIGFRGLVTIVPVGGVATFDIASNVNFETMMTGNITLAFTNADNSLYLGSSGMIILKQDVIGGRLFTLPSECKTPRGGAAIQQVTNPNSVSTLSYFVAGIDTIFVNYIGDFS